MLDNEIFVFQHDMELINTEGKKYKWAFSVWLECMIAVQACAILKNETCMNDHIKMNSWTCIYMNI